MQTEILNDDTELENLELKCKNLDSQIDMLSEKNSTANRKKLYHLLVDKTKTLKRIEFLKERETEKELKAKKTGKKIIIRRNRTY